MTTKAELQTLCQGNIIVVSFEKADGSAREMMCTLCHELDYGLSEYEFKGSQKPEHEHLLKVWDVQVGGWRSVNVEKLTSAPVLVQSLESFHQAQIEQEKFEMHQEPIDDKMTNCVGCGDHFEDTIGDGWCGCGNV